MASNEAFKKQAEGASAAAKKYMDDNELLQEVRLHLPTFQEAENAALSPRDFFPLRSLTK